MVVAWGNGTVRPYYQCRHGAVAEEGASLLPTRIPYRIGGTMPVRGSAIPRVLHARKAGGEGHEGAVAGGVGLSN